MNPLFDGGNVQPQNVVNDPIMNQLTAQYRIATQNKNIPLMQQMMILQKGLSGGPEQIGKYLLNHGIMSQEAYNNLVPKVNQIYQMLPK